MNTTECGYHGTNKNPNTHTRIYKHIYIYIYTSVGEKNVLIFDLGGGTLMSLFLLLRRVYLK